jgi:sister chromatid cohesion protein DCC1
LEIRDVCHSILEPLPCAPNLERIRKLLRPSSWRGLGEDDAGSVSRKRKRGDEGKRWSRQQLGSVIQASDGELEKGLRERNVVEVDGECEVGASGTEPR